MSRTWKQEAVFIVHGLQHLRVDWIKKILQTYQQYCTSQGLQMVIVLPGVWNWGTRIQVLHLVFTGAMLLWFLKTWIANNHIQLSLSCLVQTPWVSQLALKLQIGSWMQSIMTCTWSVWMDCLRGAANKIHTTVESKPGEHPQLSDTGKKNLGCTELWTWLLL